MNEISCLEGEKQLLAPALPGSSGWSCHSLSPEAVPRGRKTELLLRQCSPEAKPSCLYWWRRPLSPSTSGTEWAPFLPPSDLPASPDSYKSRSQYRKLCSLLWKTCFSLFLSSQMPTLHPTCLFLRQKMEHNGKACLSPHHISTNLTFFFSKRMDSRGPALLGGTEIPSSLSSTTSCSFPLVFSTFLTLLDRLQTCCHTSLLNLASLFLSLQLMPMWLLQFLENQMISSFSLSPSQFRSRCSCWGDKCPYLTEFSALLLVLNIFDLKEHWFFSFFLSLLGIQDLPIFHFLLPHWQLFLMSFARFSRLLSNVEMLQGFASCPFLLPNCIQCVGELISSCNFKYCLFLNNS